MAKHSQSDASVALFDIDKTKMWPMMAQIVTIIGDNKGKAAIEIPKSMADTFASYSDQAVAIISATTAPGPSLASKQIAKIKAWSDGWKAFSNKLQQTDSSYVMSTVPLIEVEGKKISVAEFYEVMMNDWTNAVHESAVTVFGDTEQLAGCAITSMLPQEGYDVSKYCSGVINSLSDGTVHTGKLTEKTFGSKNMVTQYPQQISHKLGSHSVEVSTQNTGEGSVKLGIEYHEAKSPLGDSQNRMKGVQIRLEKQGLECVPKYPLLYCNGEIPEGELGNLAAFFSVLLNGDGSPVTPDKPQIIAEKAWDKATQLYAKWGDKTYAAKQGQLDWGVLHQELIAEKEVAAKLNHDLFELAKCRDKHHELENSIGIGNKAKKVPAKVGKAIVDNAEKAIALAKKNGWPTTFHGNSIEGYLATFKAELAANEEIGNTGSSADMVGHTMHQTLSYAVTKAGQYANCTPGSVDDINAGPLAYCEGVLKGESGIITQSGHAVEHSVSPLKYHVEITDENPDGSYDMVIALPGKSTWSDQLRKFLATHKHFKCQGDDASGYNCGLNLGTLDDVRDVALLLSNLRGISDSIGIECGEKALEMADKIALAQHAKGNVAFIQSPIMQTPQEWLKHCKAEYGIIPNMTEEEKETVAMLGAALQYGGCNFTTAKGTVPNKGVLAYCEGVRMNPQGVLNARMLEDGTIQHFMHNDLDDVAHAAITPLPNGKFQVNLTKIGLKNNDLQKLALQQLSKLACGMNNCNGELDEEELRLAAAFLSSFHQTNQLDPACFPKVIEHVVQQVKQLPKGLGAHSVMTHPHYKQEWEDEICAKPGTATTTTNKEPMDEGFVFHGPFDKIDVDGLGLTVPAAHIKELHDQGYSNHAIVQLVLDNKAMVNCKGKIAEPYATAVVEHVLAGVPAPAPKDTTKHKSSLPIAGQSVWKGFGPTPTPPYKFHGCTIKVKSAPTATKLEYCEGVAQETLVVGEPSPLNYGMGMFEGTSAYVNSVDGLHKIGNTSVKFGSDHNTLTFTLPPELMKVKPLVNALKNNLFYTDQVGITSTFKAHKYRATYIASLLSHASGINLLPEDCWQKAVDHAVAQAKQVHTSNPPIFPFDADSWKANVCDVSTTKADWVSDDAISNWIKDFVNNLPPPGLKWTAILEEMGKVFGPKNVKGNHFIWPLMQELVKQGKVGVTNPDTANATYHMVVKPTTLAQMPQIEVDNIADAGCILKKQGKTLDEFFNWFEFHYPKIEFGAITKGWLTETYEQCDIKPSKIKTLADLTKKQYGEAELLAHDFWKEGTSKKYVTNFIAAKFSITNDDTLSNWVGNKMKEFAPEPETSKLDQLIKADLELTSTAWSKLTDSDKKKAAQTTEYKKLPKAVQEWLHAVMDVHILMDAKDGVPYDKTVKMLQDAVAKKITPSDLVIPITPLMVKKQTDIEFKNKVAKGWIPSKPGKAPAVQQPKKYADLDTAQKMGVQDEIAKLSGLGHVPNDILGMIVNKFSLQGDSVLVDVIAGMTQGMTQDKSQEGINPEQIKQQIMDVLNSHPAEKFTGMTMDKAIGLTTSQSSISFPHMMQLVQEGKVFAETKNAPYLFWVKATSKKFEDLDEGAEDDVKNAMSDWVGQGKDKEEILAKVKASFGIEYSWNLDQWIADEITAYQEEGKVHWNEKGTEFAWAGEAKPTPKTKIIQDLDENTLKDMTNFISALMGQHIDWNKQEVANGVIEYFGIIKNDAFDDWIDVQFAKKSSPANETYDAYTGQAKQMLDEAIAQYIKNGVDILSIPWKMGLSETPGLKSKIIELYDQIVNKKKPDDANKELWTTEDGKIGACTVEGSFADLRPTIVEICKGLSLNSGTAKLLSDGSGAEYDNQNDKYVFQDSGANADMYQLGVQRFSKANWKYPEKYNDTVKAFLHQLNWECKVNKSNDWMECNTQASNGLGTDAAGNLRHTAGFLSMIDHVTELDKDCQEQATTKAFLVAALNSKLEKPWQENLYPFSVKEWNHEVCNKGK